MLPIVTTQCRAPLNIFCIGQFIPRPLIVNRGLSVVKARVWSLSLVGARGVNCVRVDLLNIPLWTAGSLLPALITTQLVIAGNSCSCRLGWG